MMTTISRPASSQPAEAAGEGRTEPQSPGIIAYLLCEAARRAYRWSRGNLGLQRRVERLKQQLPDLPRTGIGVLLKHVDPAMEMRIAPLRQPDRELVIGDFDQDGGIAPRFGRMRNVPSISATDFMTRTGFPILLVDLDGRLGVRKEFRRFSAFVQELEALLDLEASACSIPRVMNVDWDAHTITITFVPGDVVREMLAKAGADIRDRTLETAYTRSIDKERIRRGRELVPQVLSDWQVSRIASALDAIHAAGYALEDVKFGNIILDTKSEPVFIDLERALPIARLPRRIADHARALDWRKFRDHFGERQ
jgi:tRNA A-37 threonylcarbamoyl transferase component Bud32